MGTKPVPSAGRALSLESKNDLMESMVEQPDRSIVIRSKGNIKGWRDMCCFLLTIEVEIYGLANGSRSYFRAKPSRVNQ
jgi:hypothetical protein